jgi:hypothetical protein
MKTEAGRMIGELWAKLIGNPQHKELRQSLLRASLLADLGNDKFFQAHSGKLRVGLRIWDLR